jgi:hypothetical protein
MCGDVFTSPSIIDVCKTFGQAVRRPKTLLFDKSKNTGIEYTQSLLEEGKVEYPIIVKTDLTFFTKFSHAKYFIHGKEGLENMYENSNFLKEDLVIEELIPHDEDKLIKIYAIGDQVLFWRIINSVPDIYMEANSFVADNSDTKCSNKRKQ